MKINKKQLHFFLVVYDQLVSKLREDMDIYREACRQIMQEQDLSPYDPANYGDIKELAEMFFYHRIKGFEEREIGEPAVDEVLKILNERRQND